MRKPRRTGRGAREVHRITTAPEPLAEDLARRTRRYLVQMGIRVVCFVVAVLTWGHAPRWLSAILLVGAVVLPYVAVILANAGRERSDEPALFMEPRALGSRAEPPTVESPADPPDTSTHKPTTRGEWLP